MCLRYSEFKRHKMIRSLVILDEWRAFLEATDNAELREIRFKIRANDVLLLAKARNGDKSVVTFAAGDDIVDAATTLCYLLYMKEARWVKDKYPPK